MQLPIEEYFKYHPPTTPERIALHDRLGGALRVRVNQESLEICQSLIQIDPSDSDRIQAIHEQAIKLIEAVCQDDLAAEWATISLCDAKRTASQSRIPISFREESILMCIQQFRMFLNQGITVDEVRKVRESND